MLPSANEWKTNDETLHKNMTEMQKCNKKEAIEQPNVDKFVKDDERSAKLGNIDTLQLQ